MRIISKLSLILAIFGIISFGGVKQVRADYVNLEQTDFTSTTAINVGMCYYQSFIATVPDYISVNFVGGTGGHSVIGGITDYINCTTNESSGYSFISSSSLTAVTGGTWTNVKFATTSLSVGNRYFIKICHNSMGSMNIYRSTTKKLDNNSKLYYPTTNCSSANSTSDLAFRLYAISATSSPVISTSSNSINLASSTPEIMGNLISFIEKFFVSMWPFTLAISIVIGFGVMFIKFFDKVIK